MSEITRILTAIEQGDPRAAGELLPLVYAELRRLAARKRFAAALDPGFLEEILRGDGILENR